MNVLVIGCGRLGRRLAELLDHHGHDVAVVDSDADAFRMLEKDFNGMTVTGFPMDTKVLKNAGIESCDAVAVCTPDDNLNITISQIAKEFLVCAIVARISTLRAKRSLSALASRRCAIQNWRETQCLRH